MQMGNGRGMIVLAYPTRERCLGTEIMFRQAGLL